MSDKIKTGHGTVGLLMVEVEQLRRHLALTQNKLQHEEEMRKSDCDDWMKERRRADKLQADNAVLRGDLEKWAAACAESRIGLVIPMPPLVEALHKELEKAKDELGAWHSAFGTTQLTHALAAYEKAKAENARLTDSIRPTIELLEQLTYPAVSAINNEAVHREIDRLCSILRSDENSEKVKS